MRAKTIYETLEFKQGEDPYKTLNIGAWENINDGDSIQLLEDIYWEWHTGEYCTKKDLEDTEDSYFDNWFEKNGPDIIVNTILYYKSGSKSFETKINGEYRILLLDWVLRHKEIFKLNKQKIYEFKQDGDPYKKLSLGSHRKFNAGDIIKFKQPLYYRKPSLYNSNFKSPDGWSTNKTKSDWTGYISDMYEFTYEPEDNKHWERFWNDVCQLEFMEIKTLYDHPEWWYYIKKN